MSTFFSNKYLKYRSLAGGAAKRSESDQIDADLLCRGCGYNLRGLNYGRNCPECGQEIVRIQASDALLIGDWSHRQRVYVGLMCLSLSVFYAAFSRLALFIALVFLGLFGAAKLYLWFGLIASAAWIVGVWIITDPRLHRPSRLMSVMLWSARLLSLLWIPGYVIWIRSLQIGNPWFAGPMTNAAATNIVLRTGAAIGAYITAILLCRLAVRADLEDSARRIHLSLWLLPVTTLLLLMVPSSVQWIFMFVIVLCVLAWCWSMFLLARGVWGMAEHVRWSLRLTEEQFDRQNRQSVVRRELDDEANARVRPTPAALDDLPLHDATRTHATRATRAGD